MKTEFSVSFIFDLSRTDELDRMQQILNYARSRGVAIRADLEHLSQATKTFPPMMSYPCPRCQIHFPSKKACQNHSYICKGLPYVLCELGCGELHEDTAQGRGQHRRFRHPKEAPCAV